jgi:surfactin synthase thioesterase subunit
MSAATVNGESRWLLCRRRCPDAVTRLYCLPHSGGSAGEFLFWSDVLPDVEVWGVQLPGHGNRRLEPSLTTMPQVVAAIADSVRFEPPYALFGHSMGAAVAYELALELRSRGLPLPERLYVSSREPPHRHRADKGVLSLTDGELLDELGQQYGDIPAELRDDPDWRALVLGSLRADLGIITGYQPSEAPPLPCPIVAMGGTQDPTVSEEDLRAWDSYTTGTFGLQMFAGGHFYFREDDNDVHRYFTADLARTAR